MSAAPTRPTSDGLESDTIVLTIPARTSFVRLVRIGVASVARRKGMSVRAIDDLRLAVDETFQLLLGDDDHGGSVDVTLAVDDHEIVVTGVQRLTHGAIPVDPEDLVRFELVLTDLVDRFDADPETGVAQFSKRVG